MAERRPIQSWPQVPHPWTPYPWIVGGAGDGVFTEDRVCLGSQCWPLRRMAFFQADEIKNTLLKRSWPLSQASVLAVALYEVGYYQQARAVGRMYGGHYGVEAWNNQIKRVYDGSLG